MTGWSRILGQHPLESVQDIAFRLPLYVFQGCSQLRAVDLPDGRSIHVQQRSSFDESSSRALRRRGRGLVRAMHRMMFNMVLTGYGQVLVKGLSSKQALRLLLDVDRLSC